MYWLLILFYTIIIYLSIIVVCMVLYSMSIVLMVVGIEVNKRIMYAMECFMEFLFHPLAYMCELFFACINGCRRSPRVEVDRIDTLHATNNPLYKPPIKEIEMVVIVNPCGIPIQIGSEAVLWKVVGAHYPRIACALYLIF